MKKGTVINLAMLAVAALAGMTLHKIYSPKTQETPPIQSTYFTTFDQAKKQPPKRQGYIDQIVSVYSVDDLSYVKYVDQKKEAGIIPGEDVMHTYKNFKPQSTQGEIHIEVYKTAFEVPEIKTEDDFKSLIFDHEYYHVKQLSGKAEFSLTRELLPEFQEMINLSEEQSPLLATFLELGAYQNQINSFSVRKVSPSFKEKINFSRKEYYDILSEEDFDNSKLAKYLKQYYNPFPPKDTIF